ncbi:MAG TPA: methyltransferase domain-containing protein [Bdellovibrionota bacterium]|nr:methyltransferase domain-containing protein [Bdellovibrionota bacterium]
MEGESLDSISGCFRLFQLENGHRFSTDDLLVAWYGTSWAPCPAKVLDLGSGVGSVGMIAAWRLPGSNFVTIEAQEESVQLARKSAQYNGLLDRYEIRRGDFRDSKILADDERFDLILGSPPYFPLGSGIESDHPQKVACRFEVRGDISDYCRVASAHLNWGGLFACVFPITPEEQSRRVERAAHESGLSIIRRRPIIFREGEQPLLSVFAMSRADHLPPVFRDKTWGEPALTIRCRDGSVHPEYQAVKLAIGFPP